MIIRIGVNGCSVKKIYYRMFKKTKFALHCMYRHNYK